ncbi:MAG: DNA translocase FtsK, partial [Erysipelotrichia bacterium]|nr:DNA translocase FtsK [Erysipelotrichia bacterium]
FIEAGNIIMEAGAASISLIQRKLAISYSRGVTIIEQLEDAGVISEYDGVNPRKVTMSKEKWNSLKYEL